MVKALGYDIFYHNYDYNIHVMYLVTLDLGEAVYMLYVHCTLYVTHGNNTTCTSVYPVLSALTSNTIRLMIYMCSEHVHVSNLYV